MKNLTIRQLVNELLKYPNLDADANFIFNGVNDEVEDYDITDCEIDFMQQDVEDSSVYDIMITPPNKDKRERERDNISKLLDDNDKLTIVLDKYSEYDNIVIKNDNNEVLREIQVGGNYEESVNIINILQSIL